MSSAGFTGGPDRHEIGHVGESYFFEFLKDALFRDNQLLGGPLCCLLFDLFDAFSDMPLFAEARGISRMRIESRKRISFADLPALCHLLGEDFVLSIQKWWHE